MIVLVAALHAALTVSFPSALAAGANEQGSHDPRAPAQLVLDDRMGALFRLEEVNVHLDGRAIDTPPVSPRSAQVLFDEELSIGRHDLSVHLVYAGEGEGMTSYLNDYLFDVYRLIAFEVREPGTVVTLVADESGGLTTELSDQPSLKYRVDDMPQP